MVPSITKPSACQTHPDDIEELPGIQMLADLMQAGGGPQVDLLAVVADGCVDDAQIDKVVGGQAALLAQFALGGLKRVLAGSSLPAGSSQISSPKA